MTAPILWHGHPDPMPAGTQTIVGPLFAGVKQRTADSAMFDADIPVVPGDLWPREAERDVLMHGEPQPITNREKVRRMREQAHPMSPWNAREILDELVRYRRSEMRAAAIGHGSE